MKLNFSYSWSSSKKIHEAQNWNAKDDFQTSK